jgi:hypothetical protein
MLTCWDRLSYDYGLVTSVKKTKIMFVAKPPAMVPPQFSIRGEPVEVVHSFRYLGVILTSDATMDAEISTRVSSAHAAWLKYKHTVFLNRHLSLRTRVTMFKVTIVTALLYGAEAWAQTVMQQRRLEVVYNTLIRQMLGVRWWHRRSTEQVLSVARLPKFERYVAARTLRWQGHVVRMPAGRFPKLVMDDSGSFVTAPRGGRVMNIATWAKQCVKATEIAINYFPSRPVPHATDIIADRTKWRYFTAPNDAGTSWDSSQRSAWIAAHRHGTPIDTDEQQATRPRNRTPRA